MAQEHHITFGPFRLDTTQGRLWRGEQAITLRPRSLAMLRYLVEHPGRLVTKAELRQHVWAGTHVTDTVLRVCVREIRAALGDAAAAPQYLETVGRQGYRFLCRETAGGPPPADGRARRGAPGRSRRPGEVVPARRQRRTASSSSSVAKRGLARRRWSTCWLARLAAEQRGADRARAVRRALWGGGTLPAVVGGPGAARPRARRGTRSSRCCGGMRRMWLVQLPGLVSEPSWSACSARCRGRRRRACCANSPRRSTC